MAYCRSCGHDARDHFNGEYADQCFIVGCNPPNVSNNHCWRTKGPFTKYAVKNLRRQMGLNEARIIALVRKGAKQKTTQDDIYFTDMNRKYLEKL